MSSASGSLNSPVPGSKEEYQSAEERAIENQTTGLIDRFDQFCNRFGDSLNPILVKETRQALKSRQFVITFSILLFAALAWTIIGSLSMMPQIYSNPSAPRMLIGYYAVLAIPMLLVVPLAAYRSLEGEIDDGTLELLSITVLSPWQIVLGKLASANLQMLLYFVALFPCVAYAYTLRGIDLPTIGIIMSILLVAGLLLTVISLFFAPMAESRTGRIATLLAVMVALLLAEWGIGSMVVGLILYGNPLSVDQVCFAIVAVLLISLSLGHLLLAATAAQLTPEVENRSTQIRVSLLILTAIALGLSAFAILVLDEVGAAIAFAMSVSLAVLWTIASSLMCGESSIITPRVRRELPSSFLARATLTWLTPGPTTGLVFAVIAISLQTALIVFALSAFDLASRSWIRGSEINMFARLCVTYSGYLVGFLVCVHWLVRLVRRQNNPRVEIGFAALVAISVMAALIPYSIGLHLNDYRSYDYSFWQITNWIWTLDVVSDSSRYWASTWFIIIVSGIAFAGTMMMHPELVLARRTATPDRVKAELDRIGKQSL